MTVLHATMSILLTVWDTYHMTVLLQNSQPLSVAFHIRDAFGATFRDNLSTVRDKVLDQASSTNLGFIPNHAPHFSCPPLALHPLFAASLVDCPP